MLYLVVFAAMFHIHRLRIRFHRVKSRRSQIKFPDAGLEARIRGATRGRRGGKARSTK
jgi:hypothetical protein